MHRGLIRKFCLPGSCRWWLMALLACLHASTVSAAWTKTANTATVANGSVGRYWTAANTTVAARANAILLDSSGNVYSTGFRDSGSNALADLLVAKHDSAGNLLWEAVYDGGNYDEGTAIALDGAGNLYVTGRSFNGTDEDIVIIKYLADGTQSWLRIYDSTTGDDVPVAVVADATNVYVTGHSNNGVNQDIVTIHYDDLGAGLQVAVFNDAQNGNDRPVGIGLDSLGNVYVGGRSVAVALDNDYVLLKYAAGNLGSLLWTRTYDSGQRDDATAMTVDRVNDKVYLTGWSFVDGVRNFATVAFAADGSTPWGSGTAVARTSPFLSGNHIPAAIATDPAGNAYVTGRSGTEFAFDFYTVKYDAAGNLAWASNPAYDSGGNDEPAAIAVDAGGKVYVVGMSGPLGSRNLSTVFYDNTGAQTDVLSYDAGGDETAGGIALGADNEGLSTVHIAGGSDRVLSTGLPAGDFSLVKYGVMRSDLVVNSLSGPVQGASDGLISINDSISNLQDSASGRLSDAGSFTVAYYLASTSNPATATLFPLLDAFNSALNATRTLTGLASGQNSAVPRQVLVPSVAAVPEGNYWLAAKADVNNVIPERDETNNLLIGGAISIVNPPDLNPTAVSTVSSALAASTIPVNYTIANLRPVAAAAFPVSFVLSTDSVIGNGDDIPMIGRDTVTGGIAGNSSFSQTGFLATIPNTTVPGTYFIGVIADPDNSILESDITNNSLLSTAPITVLVIPDLTVTAVSGDASAVVGGGTLINNTVQSANASASNIQVDFYLSADALITTGDILLGSRTIAGPMAADTTDTAATPVTVPAGTAQGVYYLGAIVDGANSIPESNDGNNSLAASNTISIGLAAGQAGAQPDLIISNATGPAAAARNTTVAVSTTVENILPEPVNTSFDVGIYMSQDPVITTADIFLGSRNVLSLAGNTTDTASTNVTIPQEDTAPVSWTDTVNVVVNGNSLTSANGSPVGFTSGAASVERLTGDGYAEFTVIQVGQGRAFGLSNTNTGVLDSSIQYAIELNPTTGADGFIMENGAVKTANVIHYASGDKFRVQRTGTVITYQQCNPGCSVIYTSTVPSSGSLLADVSLFNFNSLGTADVSNVTLTNTIVPGTYYLGAIADINNTVAEVDENNNAAVQSDVNGTPSGSTISVVRGGSSSGGGGLLAWGELLGLLGYLLARRRRL